MPLIFRRSLTLIGLSKTWIRLFFRHKDMRYFIGNIVRSSENLLGVLKKSLSIVTMTLKS
jgi:hypothetical protein